MQNVLNYVFELDFFKLAVDYFSVISKKGVSKMPSPMKALDMEKKVIEENPFYKSPVHNGKIYGRLYDCINQCETRNLSTTALHFLENCPQLANPFSTKEFDEFVTNLESYLSGKPCDVLSMLSFIADNKDRAFKNYQADRENKRRYESEMSKFKITRGTFIAWFFFLVEVDKRWTESDTPTTYLTQQQAIKEIWEEKKDQILTAKFDPVSAEDTISYTSDDLKRIQKNISNATLQTFSYYFRTYLDYCRPSGQTISGKKLSPKRKNSSR